MNTESIGKGDYFLIEVNTIKTGIICSHGDHMFTSKDPDTYINPFYSWHSVPDCKGWTPGVQLDL